MTDTSFEDRLARLNCQPRDVTPEPDIHEPEPEPTRKLPFSVKFLIGLVCIPMGMIGSVTAKLFLDPDITPDAAMYLPLLAVVVGIHLALFGSGIAALVTRLSKPVLNWIVLQSLVGYGLMSALLAVALR